MPRITELTAITGIDDTDAFVLVDATDNTTKQVTYLSLYTDIYNTITPAWSVEVINTNTTIEPVTMNKKGHVAMVTSNVIVTLGDGSTQTYPGVLRVHRWTTSGNVTIAPDTNSIINAANVGDTTGTVSSITLGANHSSVVLYQYGNINGKINWFVVGTNGTVTLNP